MKESNNTSSKKKGIWSFLGLGKDTTPPPLPPKDYNSELNQESINKQSYKSVDLVKEQGHAGHLRNENQGDDPLYASVNLDKKAQDRAARSRNENQGNAPVKEQGSAARSISEKQGKKSLHARIDSTRKLQKIFANVISENQERNKSQGSVDRSEL